MKTLDAFSIAVAFIAVMVSICTFAITIYATIELTETTKFLFFFMIAALYFAATLAMSHGYIKGIMLSVRNIKEVMLMFMRVHRRYDLGKLNASMEMSCQRSLEKEPLLKAYKDFVCIQFRLNPKTKEMKIKRDGDKVVALIPSSSMDTIVMALSKHISDNLSKTSIVKDFERLQKSLDLVALTLILKETGINGPLTESIGKVLKEAFMDEYIKHLYENLTALNENFKKEQRVLDRRLLRIVLVEVSKGISNAVSRRHEEGNR